MVEIKIDLLITAGYLLNPGYDLQLDAAVAIKDQRIVDVGDSQALMARYESETVLSRPHALLMPGLVDAHTHACQQLLRPCTVDELPMVWSRILVPFEACLGPEDVYISAMAACVEMIKAGITCFADAGGPHMGQVAKAVVQTGLRGVLARSTMDTGDFLPEQMRETTRAAVDQGKEFFQDFNGEGNGRVRVWFGLRELMTCSTELIRLVHQAASEYDTGIHLHLAEYRNEVDYCLVRYGRRPVEWLASQGLLSNRLLAAHSVLLTDAEVVKLAQSGAGVAHCPRSNLSNHGFPKVNLFRTLGTAVGIGTDGGSAGPLDLFNAMRYLKYATQAYSGLPISEPAVLPARELMDMVTIGAARALRMEGEIGSVAIGKKADLILIDLEQAHIGSIEEVNRLVVSCVQPGDVRDVVVDGRVVMEDRIIKTCDEMEILLGARDLQRVLLRRAGLK